MENSARAVEEVSTPVSSSAAEHQRQDVKQEQESCGAEAATGKTASKALNSRLREPDPSSEAEDDNEGKPGRSKPGQRRPLRCQVDGCGADLAQARKYFQRYRVCEGHLKAPSLQMDGRSVRFCDQCSKFHEISMFEGIRRTCNDKLERTRQARSDKRRQQTERAERAAMRANGGWRPRLHSASGLKRQHGELHGECDHEDDVNEEFELQSGDFELTKRNRSLPPPLSADGAAVLASPSDQLEAQGILALHRAALAAAAAAGRGAAAAAAAASAGAPSARGLHVHHINGAGSNDGGGCGGGGGASSLSSWDDGQPHLRLMQTDSVSSRPGSAGGSHDHGHGTPYVLAGGGAGSGAAPATTGGGSGRESMAFLHATLTGRDSDEWVRPIVSALRAGAAGPLTAAQAATVLHDLYGIVDGGGGDSSPAAGRVDGGGMASAKTAGLVSRDARSRVEALLVAALLGGDGGAATREIVGMEHPQTPCMPALSVPRRTGRDAVQYGGGGGGSVRDQSAAAVTAVEQLLLSQLQAAEAGGMAERAAPVSYNGACALLAAPGSSRPLMGDVLYGSGRAGNGVGSSGDGCSVDDDDAAVAAALRALVESLAARRGMARTHYESAAVQRLTDCRLGEGALAAAQLLLPGLGAASCASEPAFRHGIGGAAVGPDCRTGFRAPVMFQREPAGRGAMLPVLDLGEAPAPVVAAAPLRLSGGGGAGARAGDDPAWRLQRLQQQEMQQHPQQRARASAFRAENSIVAAAAAADRRLQQQQPLLLHHQQQYHHQHPQEHQQHHHQEQHRHQEQNLHLHQRQQLRWLDGRDVRHQQQQLQQLMACSDSAAVAAAPLPLMLGMQFDDGRVVQLQRERVEEAAAARYHHHQQQQSRAAYGEVPAPRSPEPRKDVGSQFRHLRNLQERLHQLGVQVVLQ